MEEFLEIVTERVTVHEWFIALGVFCAIAFGAHLINTVVVTRIIRLVKRTESKWDDMVIVLLKSIHPSTYYVLAVLIALQTLPLPNITHKISIVLLAFMITYYLARLVGVAGEYIAEKMGAHDPETLEQTKAAVGLMAGIVKILVWIASGLFVISNFGVDITSLVAGLGIGGLAVALALQNILKDLFSSFSIFFDKPFAIGDFIDIGEHSGTVQKIGIKTTRIKALSGEEVVISNQDLTDAKLHNYKRMEERRVSFKIGVTYETPRAKVAAIPGLVQKAIEKVEHVRFGRTHFNSFDDWALTFEIVYFVESSDYVLYMDVQQEINLGIMEAFETEKINMAYPTQTVYQYNGEM